MKEWLLKTYTWLTIPCYAKVLDRDLLQHRLELRDAEAQAAYSRLMVEYLQEAIKRDEAHIAALRLRAD